MKQQLSELLRPTELADLIQPFELIQRLERMVERRALVNMLFHGKPGLGKTSAARIILKKLDTYAYRLNGSMETGINSVRDHLEDFCVNPSLDFRLKVVFIDESDFLSPNAQAGLRGLIEKTAVPFIMTANDITKFDRALTSRCLPVNFDVGPLQATEVIKTLLPRFQEKLAHLGYSVDDKRLWELMCVSFPDLRSLANQIEFEYGPPSEERAALFQMEQDGE